MFMLLEEHRIGSKAVSERILKTYFELKNKQNILESQKLESLVCLILSLHIAYLKALINMKIYFNAIRYAVLKRF